MTDLNQELGGITWCEVKSRKESWNLTCKKGHNLEKPLGDLLYPSCNGLVMAIILANTRCCYSCFSPPLSFFLSSVFVFLTHLSGINLWCSMLSTVPATGVSGMSKI